MRSLRAVPLAVLAAASALVSGCGEAAPARQVVAAAMAPGAAAAAPARWRVGRHVRGAVDLSAPRADGSIVVAARGRLQTLSAAGALTLFAPAYTAPPGLEPYVVLSSGERVADAACRFAPGDLYALRLSHGDGVTIVDRAGRVRKFASLPRRGLENGIAFDTSGRFGYRLLVSSVAAGVTTVFAVDCRGRVSVLTRSAPRVEGGLVVAPAAFGRFGGDLIAPDELTGRLYAIAPDGRATLIATSGLAHGPDTGSESEGFVPARFRDALVADRRTRGNRHPGDDAVLSVSRAALTAAGVRAGDLLVVDEGGAGTVAVTCASKCRVRTVASGPAIAHIEGHVVFSGAPRAGIA